MLNVLLGNDYSTEENVFEEHSEVINKSIKNGDKIVTLKNVFIDSKYIFIYYIINYYYKLVGLIYLLWLIVQFLALISHFDQSYVVAGQQKA